MGPVTHAPTAVEIKKMTLGQEIHYLSQSFQALGREIAAEYHRNPREVVSVLTIDGLAISAMIIVIIVIIAVPIFFAKVKSWAVASLIVYIKTRYPDEWHSPVNLRMLLGISLLFIIGMIPLMFLMVASAFSIWGWLAIGLAFLVFLGSLIALDLNGRLLAEAPHRFDPRRPSLYLMMLTDEQKPIFSPQLLRLCARLRIIPTADIDAWPCRICGQRRFCTQHGFFEPIMP